MSYRQAKRIRRAVKNIRVRGLTHGNVGRPPPNRISVRVKQQVLNLSRRVYEGFDDLHFTEMLSELARDTQFVVITHNRLTVQAADVVYGVTMGSDSASKVISLKLDEAEREIAA